jgi:hypothetical protein
MFPVRISVDRNWDTSFVSGAVTAATIKYLLLS